MPLLKRLEKLINPLQFLSRRNALKYLMRAPRKNGLEDLQKAKQSVEFAIECWE